MNIKTLSLRNFRNFEHVEELTFPIASLLVAAAPNATGKTNFLEGLVVLLRGKSFRAQLSECVRWGEGEAVVRGRVETARGGVSLATSYQVENRRLRVEENGEVASPVEMYSQYPLVLFLPDDTFLFMRGPSARRNFLNHVLISQPHYLSALVQYHRALKQRNAALKGSARWEDIEPWTQAVVQHGERVWKERQKFSEFLASHTERIYQEIMGEKLQLTVRFVPGAKKPDQFREVLEATWTDERRYHYTLAGPHRDDLEVFSDGRLVQSVLSRGQIRGLTAALKFASWHFLRQVTGEAPLLLLDEVLSELDEARQEKLLLHLPPGQVLLTCTKVPKILRDLSQVKFLDLRAIIAEGHGESPPRHETEVVKERAEVRS
ncbi:MAG: DNA replication and repair protein RecF [Patescibacteria group bacterium]